MTRHPRLLLPALMALLAACTSDGANSQTATRAQPDTGAAQPAASSQVALALPEAVLLDSAACVLYPLALGETREEEGSYGSKSAGPSPTYWNIIFYNLRSGKTHLLTENQKIRIKFYGKLAPADAATSGQAPYPPAEKLLVYSIITTDSNHDGQLTDEDPTYVFTSDKAGENFHQISPNNVSVTGWQLHPATGKLLLHTLRDSNHDHAYGADDESAPYVYDVATGQPATRVFSPEFRRALQGKLQQQWGNKAAK